MSHHLGQRISALIDGELSDSERDRVLAHIAGCDDCRQEAVALRALKQRMHSLGEAMVDAALTGRPDGHGHATGRAVVDRPRAVAVPGVFPAARMLTAGVLASAVAGLGAAAFFAGGEQQVPGPKVTPAVDTFLVQHAIVTGDLPVTPSSGTPGSPGGSASAAPVTPASRIPVGVAASGVTGAAAAGAVARMARRAASGRAAAGRRPVVRRSVAGRRTGRPGGRGRCVRRPAAARSRGHHPGPRGHREGDRVREPGAVS